MKKSLIYVSISALLINGCATTTSNSGDDHTVRDCSIAGVGAAAVCAVASSSAGKAALCAAAAVAACLIYKHYVTSQSKSADVVNEEYKSKNGSLPKDPKLLSYTADVKPDISKRSDKVVLKSKATVIEGAENKKVVLEEQLQIIDKDGLDWAGGKRKALANTAGEFKNEFSFSPAEIKMEQGKYVVNRILFLNNVKVAEKTNQSLQITKLDNGEFVATLINNSDNKMMAELKSKHWL